MKTGGFLFFLFLYSFSICIVNYSIDAKGFYPKIFVENSDILTSKKFQVNEIKEAKSYYEKGLELNDLHQLLRAETAFLKAIELADNSDEKEILAFSYFYLGNIESWKSNFPPSILYHKKAWTLFCELHILEYVASSNNHISTGYGIHQLWLLQI